MTIFTLLTIVNIKAIFVTNNLKHTRCINNLIQID